MYVITRVWHVLFSAHLAAHRLPCFCRDIQRHFDARIYLLQSNSYNFCDYDNLPREEKVQINITRRHTLSGRSSGHKQWPGGGHLSILQIYSLNCCVILILYIYLEWIQHFVHKLKTKRRQTSARGVYHLLGSYISMLTIYFRFSSQQWCCVTVARANMSFYL